MVRRDFAFSHTEIFARGAEAKYFYFIMEGKVQIETSFQGHAAFEKTVILEPGTGFGILGLIPGGSGKRVAGAKTIANNTVLLAMPKDIFVRTYFIT